MTEDTPLDMVVMVLMAMLLLMALVGICGNTLALIVYSRKKDKLTSTTFILALAVIDFFTCVVIIPFTVYMEYINFEITSDFSCKLYWFLQTAGIPFSAFMMGAIAVDRYFCICHPFMHAINQYRAKIIIVVLAIVAFVLGLVASLGYGIIYKITVNGTTDYVTPDKLNETGMQMHKALSIDFTIKTLELYNATDTPKCTRDKVFLSKTFMSKYTYVHVFVYFVSLAVVSILYLVIYRSVIHRREHRMKQKTLGPRGDYMPTKITVELSNHDKDEIELSKLEMLDSPTGSDNSVTLPSDGRFQNGGSRKSSITERKCEVNGNTQDETNRLTVKKSLTSDDTHNMEGGKRGSFNGFTEGVNSIFQRGTVNTRSVKDKMRLANLKTAAILFVVSIIFFGTFLPACLIALNFVTFHAIVFYLFYINNVCNPIIYAFMNQNFRNDLKLLLLCQRNGRLVRYR